MIEAVDLGMTFRTGGLPGRSREVVAVRGVSLRIEPARSYAIVGQSGSGKTTLVHLLMGLLRPTAGRALLEGRDVAAVKPRERFRRVQLVLQEGKGALDPTMTVAASIAETLVNLGVCGAGEARERARSLALAVGLPASALDKRPAELSGGEAKRACIARALGPEPSYVFFDESTAGLDVVRRRAVLDAIRELRDARGFSPVLVTHDLEAALYLADRVYVMKDGELVDALAPPYGPKRAAHPYTRELFAASGL